MCYANQVTRWGNPYQLSNTETFIRAADRRGEEVRRMEFGIEELEDVSPKHPVVCVYPPGAEVGLFP
jgi:hypothetical protein